LLIASHAALNQAANPSLQPTVPIALTPPPPPRRSPYSASKAVATPQQLQQYFDLFASPSHRAAAAGGAAASPATGGYGQQGDAQGQQYDQGEAGSSPLLPLGRDAPLYRPSIVSAS